MLVTNYMLQRCPVPFCGTTKTIRSYFKWLDSMTSTNFARQPSHLHHRTTGMSMSHAGFAQRVGQTRVQIGGHYVPNLFVVDSLFEIAASAYNAVAVALLIPAPPYT